jgi:O-antigen/teichoic acid export membrane protein
VRINFQSPERSLAWAVPVLAEAAALGRSVAFAWAIGPEELGRAMILALTVRLADMVSDFGFDRMLVQAPDGNSARLQADLQGIVLVRGIVVGLILLAVAPVLAVLFESGPAWPAYAVLAIIPAVRGLAHLDFRRFERRFRYWRMASVEAGATLVMIAAILPAENAFSDHRAMPVVLIAHAVAFTILSHMVASRRYQLRFSCAAFVRVGRFGAPLALNAVLLFFTFYADRLIVAGAYDWGVLALYGVALQLALLPAQIVGRAAASLILPRLRIALANSDVACIWPRILGSHAMLACGLVAGFTLLAPATITLVYGSEFRPSWALALCLGLAAGFRILRTPLSQLAIAAGRTGDPARANVVRAIALVPAAACAATGLPLWTIAAAAAAGEAGATLRAFTLAEPTLNQFPTREALA